MAAIGYGAFWLHLALILLFLNVLPYGKHFHIITALPNVLFARLSPVAALRKLDLEAEDASFGTATVKDLSWKEGWDVYSCTECGRCQTHCPTYVTGKPLSHKEVNRAIRHHLVDAATDLTALARAKEPAAREAAAAKLPRITEIVPPETFWSCTTCGWCETACPVLIENVPRLVDMRRHDVLVESAFPEEASRVFKGIETQGNPWGIGSNKRTEWCEDLAIPRAGDGDFEWLFFVGCAGAFDDRQKKVSRAIVKILREAKVSFAILGDEETCTGDAARRLGNEYLFQMQAQSLTETLNGHGVKKILVQCPHCLNTLANELPQFGGKYEVVHHADLVARLVRDGKLSPGKAAGLGEVTFHDPCYLARWNGITEPPREALRSAGAEVKEMPRNRREGFCCGAGGGRFWLEEKLGTRVNRNRAEEAAATLGAGRRRRRDRLPVLPHDDEGRARGRRQGRDRPRARRRRDRRPRAPRPRRLMDGPAPRAAAPGVHRPGAAVRAEPRRRRRAAAPRDGGGLRARPWSSSTETPPGGSSGGRSLLPLAAAGLRVVMPDLPGLGLSEKPRDPSFHTLENHARVFGALLDAVAPGPLLLVLHDWGGPIGLAALAGRARTARRARRDEHRRRPAPARRAADPLPPVREPALRLRRRLPAPRLPAERAPPRAGRSPLHLGRRRPRLPLAAPPARRSRRAARARPDGPARARTTRRSRRSRRAQAVATAFDGPAAIVWGERDPVLGRALRGVAEALPERAVTRIAAGHYPQEEAPGAIVDAVARRRSPRAARLSPPRPESRRRSRFFTDPTREGSACGAPSLLNPEPTGGLS